MVGPGGPRGPEGPGLPGGAIVGSSGYNGKNSYQPVCTHKSSEEPSTHYCHNRLIKYSY